MSIHMARAASLQWTGLPVQGLVAHYDFTDNSGHVLTDKSGNGYHGQLGSTSGADTNDPTWGAERLIPDGVDDYVDLTIPAGVGQSWQGKTVIVVFDPTAAAAHQSKTDRFHSLVSTDNGAESRIDFRTFTSQPGPGYFITVGYVPATSPTVLNTNYVFPSELTSPLLMAQVVGNGLQQVYRGATSVHSVARTNTDFRNAFPWNLFSNPSISRPGQMPIHYAVVYNRALSQPEMQRAHQYIKSVMAARGVAIE